MTDRKKRDRPIDPSRPTNHYRSIAKERERDEAEFSLAEELRAFLRGNVAALDPATTMALLSNHGRGEEALFYATLVEDYDRVLAHHASSRGTLDHKAALQVLRMVRWW